MMILTMLMLMTLQLTLLVWMSEDDDDDDEDHGDDEEDDGDHTWKFANDVPNLAGQRVVVRALNWFLENARRVRRPAYTLDSMAQQFCRHNQINQLGNWRQRARNIFLDESIR